MEMMELGSSLAFYVRNLKSSTSLLWKRVSSQSLPKISQYFESCFVDVEVGTDCEHWAGSYYEWDLSKGEECDHEWMEAISKEMGRVVGDKLEIFKELQVGMTFKDMKEGIPCPHAIKALTHKKVDPITAIHWWYSKEAYMLTYKNKMQPVRGQEFWKIDPSSAMLPPDVVKQLGRPKMKRNREPDEARKRKGE
ncbi:hypothetical protein MTR67_032520 [Solanum verrucosum]|uniref:Uncharacterized protein n=1 Tax=Solanum verrucosum TaxID=315347 RepID=A0AAF0U4M2_SOLVR|nr:hypothetical protein MTR67_032520 [Solanum verrucosum]